MTATAVQKILNALENKTKAAFVAGFFKAYEGGYAEGDQFLGLTVPVQRKIAQQFGDLDLTEVKKLLDSPIHEHRFVGLEILVFRYERGDEKVRKETVAFYLANLERVNNWDLVDTSAPYILGDWLLTGDTKILYKLARSKNIWNRRVAMVSTLAFIRAGKLDETFRIAELLMDDSHDLIHKASGWMLREAGKKSEPALREFLDTYADRMPRTMLRYAIERFPEQIRKMYLGIRNTRLKG